VIFSILHAVESDAPALAELHREALPPGWSVAEFAAYCEAPDRTVLKASDNHVVHGVAILQFAGDEGEILTLAVRSTHRRQRMASRLMEAAIDICRKRGVSHLYLEVAETNGPARRLYNKFKFQIFGKRKDYYRSATSAPVTALIMRLDIPTAVSLVDLEGSST
jgi:[ribosomal protein S18]-alanine N-acetyltransferase